jgi:hypothetical protein
MKGILLWVDSSAHQPVIGRSPPDGLRVGKGFFVVHYSRSAYNNRVPRFAEPYSQVFRLVLESNFLVLPYDEGIYRALINRAILSEAQRGEEHDQYDNQLHFIVFWVWLKAAPFFQDGAGLKNQTIMKKTLLPGTDSNRSCRPAQLYT